MTEAGIENASHPQSDIASSEGQDANGGVVTKLLSAVGSPRLTTFLFVTAIGLILLGTLAQVYQDMWEVIEGYFRSWVVLVDLKVLFPPSFFPWALHTDWDSLAINRFPFPGGALIGSLLFINLIAAHITRFKVKARGSRLVIGLVILAIGAVTTWLVIDSGHNRHGVQGEPIVAWSTLWVLIQIGLVGLFLASVGAFAYVWRSNRPGRTIELGLSGGAAVVLAPLLVWVFAVGDAHLLTHSSLRILYQLLQGQAAATILLVGCVFLFNRRAGIVLLHAGVGLLMFGEFFVSHFAAEEQMVLQEGQTVSFARDIRSVELAIFSRSKSGRKKVVAVPLVTTGKKTRFVEGDTIDLAGLPFDMQIVKYFENSTVRPVRPGEANIADKGMGLRYVAERDTPRRGVSGGRIDLASAYVLMLDKKSGAKLGTYLLSQHFASRILPQSIEVDGKGYGLGIRFKRSNKQYQLTLLDVRKDDYVGTSMPRNYSSLVRLKDPKRDVEFETKIWMNNPLRYAGETFYQSGYNVDARGHETSTLQLVKNTGWMIPYVACMIAATGMLAHFFVLLVAFLQRVDLRNKESETDSVRRLPERSASGRQVKKTPTLAKWLVPGLALLLSALWIGSKALPPHRSGAELDLDAFGALPLMYEGRVKPFDTLARNSLRVLSNRETFKDTTGHRQPAIRWLLDVIARPRDAEKYPVFRVDSLELLESLGLERRPGFRYSWEEIRSGTMAIQKQLATISKQSPEERTYYQRKLVELSQRIRRYRTLSDSFHPLPLPPFPDKEAIAKDREAAAKTVTAIDRLVKQVPRMNKAMMAMQPPLAAPVGPPDQPWMAYAAAKNAAYVNEYLRQEKPNPILAKLANIFSAYQRENAGSFNNAVADYRSVLASSPPMGFDPRITDLESRFNHFAPFYNLIPLYAIGLLLTLFGWLALPMPRLSELMRSSAFWVVLLACVVHAIALAARVAISGRPPVTNLYSSAVFIGWGCVLIGLFLEWLFRLGIGNLLATVTGIGALIVAHFLAGGGDTIRVLQAVLDTQFWLTTHVLTVALGYSATFLAGAIGIVLILWRLLGKSLLRIVDRWSSPDRDSRPAGDLESRCADVQRILGTMIFGTICFGAFMSFVGTVLGGLWADDSWGRFWGWDPKENGALVIVMWNTLVLHARSAKLVKDRGLALLAIAGNMVTAWSWFGVNELGVGLHSYGFTEGAARALLLFWISQLIIIGIGMIPVFIGWFRKHPAGDLSV